MTREIRSSTSCPLSLLGVLLHHLQSQNFWHSSSGRRFQRIYITSNQINHCIAALSHLRSWSPKEKTYQHNTEDRTSGRSTDSSVTLKIIKIKNVDLHFIDDPARHVSLDLVLASASGVGFPLLAIRTSQTRITPSDDADATIYGSSSSEPPLFLDNTTMPLTRAA